MISTKYEIRKRDNGMYELVSVVTEEHKTLIGRTTKQVFENFVACGTLEEVEHAKCMVEHMKEWRGDNTTTLKTASEMRVVSDKGGDAIVQRALVVIEKAAILGHYNCTLNQPEFRGALRLDTKLEELGYVVNRDNYQMWVSW